MRIFIDIDNTLGNLIEHYLIWYNNMFIYKSIPQLDNSLFIEDEKPLDTNILYIFDKPNFPEWTLLWSGTGSLEKEKERMIQIFNHRDFWRTELVFRGAREVLYELDEKYEVYLLTSPSMKSTHFFNGRIEWVQTNFPKFDYNKIIFCKDKYLLGKIDDILIDDHEDNIKQWPGYTIMACYPYNSMIKATKYFNTQEWNEVPMLIENIILENKIRN